MPCSVGILPPTAGSCSTRLTHISTPAPPCCAWFILVPLPPTQALQSAARSASADQSSALLLEDYGRDDWLKQSQARAWQGSLWVFDVRSPPLVLWEWILLSMLPESVPNWTLRRSWLLGEFFVGLHSSVKIHPPHYTVCFGARAGCLQKVGGLRPGSSSLPVTVSLCKNSEGPLVHSLECECVWEY